MPTYGGNSVEYLNLYKGIKNPVNMDSINQILDAYTDNTIFYEGLIDTDLSKKVVRRYNRADNDRFLTFIFNEWKQSIHSIVLTGRSTPEWKNVFTSLDRYLSTKNPTTAEEVREVLYPKNCNDQNIIKGLENLSWTRLGEFSSWTHVDSSFIYLGQHDRNPVEHRLYVNCDSDVVDKIGYEIASRCRKAKLRYYFKYDAYGTRADTIVVYTNTTNLPKFRKMLNDIVRENNLQRKIHKPPLLTGLIDGWIGYGTEPQKVNGKRESFNSIREKHLESCIKKATGLWIKNNLGFQIILNGQQISYEDYFVSHLAYIIKTRMGKLLKDKPTDLERYGYTRKDIESPEFDKALKSIIRRNIGAIISSLTDKDKKLSAAINIHGKKVDIPSGYIMASIKKQIKTISRISTTYKPCLLKIIKQTSKEAGIYDENYAFDIKGVEMFAIEDSINKMLDNKEGQAAKQTQYKK